MEVLLDQTPFYGESGGQVGDMGRLRAVEGDSSSPPTSTSGNGVATLDVRDVRKAAAGALHIHKARVSSGELCVGQAVAAEVDRRRRASVAAHHTATHLLQAALRQVLGPDVAQQGSLVEPNRLRFDFNLARGMNAEEVARVEELINGWVVEDHELTTRVMRLQEAKEAGTANERCLCKQLWKGLGQPDVMNDIAAAGGSKGCWTFYPVGQCFVRVTT